MTTIVRQLTTKLGMATDDIVIDVFVGREAHDVFYKRIEAPVTRIIYPIRTMLWTEFDCHEDVYARSH